MKLSKIVLSLGLLWSFAGADGIEEDMSYRVFKSIYHVYILKGGGEECEITYRDKEELHDTTCKRLTNSKNVKIYCTKTKKMCKTEKEVDDFVKLIEVDVSEEIKLKEFLNKWSNAHSDKDFSIISISYSPKVKYYGKNTYSTDVVSDKISSLKKYPNFHQSIGNISYREIDSESVKVMFEKHIKLTKNGETKTYPSYLYIYKDYFQIFVESDTVTDAAIEKKSVKVESSSELCKKTISQMKFATTNPYKLKGKCVKGEFKIVNVISETEAFAFDVKYKINPYSFQVSSIKTGDKAVHISAKGSLSDNFAEGAIIKGLFKVIGTKKAESRFKGEITVNTLEMISGK